MSKISIAKQNKEEKEEEEEEKEEEEEEKVFMWSDFQEIRVEKSKPNNTYSSEKKLNDLESEISYP